MAATTRTTVGVDVIGLMEIHTPPCHGDKRPSLHREEQREHVHSLSLLHWASPLFLRDLVQRRPHSDLEDKGATFTTKVCSGDSHHIKRHVSNLWSVMGST